MSDPAILQVLQTLVGLISASTANNANDSTVPVGGQPSSTASLQALPQQDVVVETFGTDDQPNLPQQPSATNEPRQHFATRLPTRPAPRFAPEPTFSTPAQTGSAGSTGQRSAMGSNSGFIGRATDPPQASVATPVAGALPAIRLNPATLGPIFDSHSEPSHGLPARPGVSKSRPPYQGKPKAKKPPAAKAGDDEYDGSVVWNGNKDFEVVCLPFSPMVMNEKYVLFDQDPTLRGLQVQYFRERGWVMTVKIPKAEARACTSSEKHNQLIQKYLRQAFQYRGLAAGLFDLMKFCQGGRTLY